MRYGLPAGELMPKRSPESQAKLDALLAQGIDLASARKMLNAAYLREWQNRPENKARFAAKRKAYKSSPAGRAWESAYRAKHREKARRLTAKWRASPENKQRKKDYDNGWWRRAWADPAEAARLRAKLERDYEAFKERYHSDPVFRAKLIAKRKAQYEHRALRRNLQRPSEGQRLMAQIKARIPEGFPHEIRDDLINELFMAIYEGKTTLAKIGTEKELRKYTARARKLLAETWNQSSLDDAIPGRDDGMTWKDALSEDAPHF